MGDQQNPGSNGSLPASSDRSDTSQKGKITGLEKQTSGGAVIPDEEQIRPGKIKILVQSGITTDDDFWQARYSLKSFIEGRERERQAAEKDFKSPQGQNNAEKKRAPYVDNSDTRKIESLVLVAIAHADDYLRGLTGESPSDTIEVITNDLDELNNARKAFQVAGVDLQTHPYSVTQLARLLMKNVSARIGGEVEPSESLLEETGIRPRLTSFEKLFLRAEAFTAR